MWCPPPPNSQTSYQFSCQSSSTCISECGTPSWACLIYCLPDILSTCYLISYLLLTWYLIYLISDILSAAYQISYIPDIWYPIYCLPNILPTWYLISYLLLTWYLEYWAPELPLWCPRTLPPPWSGTWGWTPSTCTRIGQNSGEHCARTNKPLKYLASQELLQPLTALQSLLWPDQKEDLLHTSAPQQLLY